MVSNGQLPAPQDGEHERIGRYELLHECSPGAIGGLWAARIASGTHEGRIMSLRCIAPRAGIDAKLVQEVCEAAWAAMELRIDGVLPVADVVVSDGRVGVVRDYVEGDALGTIVRAARSKAQPIPVPVVLRIALDALASLAAMDEIGRTQADMAEYLFGGLWTERIVIHANGQVSIGDLELLGKGVAAAIRSRDPEMLAFRAPEHIHPGGSLDARTDVFLMGAVLWELLAARRLFEGQCDPDLSQAIVSATIPRLDSAELKLSPAVDSAIADVVEKALQRSSDERFASAEQMRAALEKASPAVATAAELASFASAIMQVEWSKRRAILQPFMPGSLAAAPAAQPAANPAQRPPRPAASIPRPAAARKTAAAESKPEDTSAQPSKADKPADPAALDKPEAKPGDKAPSEPETSPDQSTTAAALAQPNGAEAAQNEPGKPVGRINIKSRLESRRPPAPEQAHDDTKSEELSFTPPPVPNFDAPSGATPAEAVSDKAEDQPVRPAAPSSVPLDDSDMLEVAEAEPQAGETSGSSDKGYAIELGQEQGAKKRKMLLIAGAAAALVVIVAIIAFASSGSDSTEAATTTDTPPAASTPAPPATPTEPEATASAAPSEPAPSSEPASSSPSPALSSSADKPKPKLVPIVPSGKKPIFKPKAI